MRLPIRIKVTKNSSSIIIKLPCGRSNTEIAIINTTNCPSISKLLKTDLLADGSKGSTSSPPSFVP